MRGRTLPLWPEAIAAEGARGGGSMRWDPRRYGSIDDPCHKSHLESLVGEYGCSRRFELDRRAEASRAPRSALVSGQMLMGTVVHAVLERTVMAPHVMSQLREGAELDLASTLRVVRDEWERHADGLDVRWGRGESLEAELARTAEMVRGVMLTWPARIKAPRLAEAGFIAPLGSLWTEGHIDLVFEAHGGRLALLDWKRGTQLPPQVVLDHGWEGAIYSAALRHGVLLPRWMLARWRTCGTMAPELPREDRMAMRDAESERDAMHAALRGCGRLLEAGKRLPGGVIMYGQFPEEIYRVHLRDFVPYRNAGSKTVTRPDEIAHFGLSGPGTVRYKAGDVRGPGWYRVRRTEQDLPRLERMLRTVVGLVRMGKFVEAIGKQCVRCGHSGVCLTSGYGLGESDMRAVNSVARQLDCDGFAALDGLELE